MDALPTRDVSEKIDLGNSPELVAKLRQEQGLAVSSVQVPGSTTAFVNPGTTGIPDDALALIRTQAAVAKAVKDGEALAETKSRLQPLVLAGAAILGYFIWKGKIK